MVPHQLELLIHGLLDDYLGRGRVPQDGSVKCSKLSDCEDVQYCKDYGERTTCTGGGICVCSRAHYHVALDEALQPAANKPTGYFELKSGEAGVSPIYTEPYWSNDVGVRIYRDVGWLPGFFTLVGGLAAGGVSLFSAFVLKVGLKKEKLY
jgi:nicastrin